MSTTPDRRVRPRTVIAVTVIIVLVAAVYLVVIALYASSGRITVAGADTEPDDDVVVLSITPERVDAASNRIVVSVVPVSTGALRDAEDGLTLDEDFSVLVSGADGTKTIDYPAHQVISATEVQLVADGYIERWPFDEYTVSTLMIAVHSVDGVVEPMKTVITGAGRVPGWNVDAEMVGTGETIAVDGEQTEASVLSLTATRNGSTVAFGVVLLSLMIVMPVLVLTVAITVYRGRRKVEATVMSWIGAMLFATIPLRNFLPGSPPIGSWVDYLIVLWVIAGLVAGLVIFVLAWLRRGPAGDEPA